MRIRIATALLIVAQLASTLPGAASEQPTIASLKEKMERLDTLKKDLAFLVKNAADKAPGSGEFEVEGLLGEGVMRNSFIVRHALKISEPDKVAASSAAAPNGDTIYNLRSTMGNVEDTLVALTRASGRKLLIDKGIASDRLNQRLSINMTDKRIDALLDVVLGLVQLEHTLDEKYLTVVLPRRKGFASKAEYLEAKAVETYMRSLLNNPQSRLAPEAYDDLAKISHRRGNYAAALAQCRTLIKKHPGSPEAIHARFRMGQIRLALEDNENARRELLHFIDLAPDSPKLPQAQMLIGDSFAGENKYEEAIRWYQQSIKSGNTDASKTALIGIGRMLFKKGDYAQAVDVFNSLIERFPQAKETPEILFRQSGALTRLGKPVRARATLNVLLKHYPASRYSMEACYQLADSLYREGEKIAAIEAYRGAIREFPDGEQTAEARLRLARLYNILGLYKSTRGVLRDLIDAPDAGDDRIEALRLIAQADKATGNMAKAQEDYFTLASLTTGSTRHEARLQAARIAGQRGHHRDALLMLSETLQDQPEPEVRRKVYRAAAECYIALGRPEKALAIYRGKSKPENGQAREVDNAGTGKQAVAGGKSGETGQ